MKTVKALVGDNVIESKRCCGESGTLGVTRPDISTQIRFRKEEEIKKGEAQLRAAGTVGAQDNIKMLTSCPSCLQGLTRYGDDLNNGLLEADYIVVEMANQILGKDWLPQYVAKATRAASNACWSDHKQRNRRQPWPDSTKTPRHRRTSRCTASRGCCR